MNEPPLTWIQARRKLQQVLKQVLENPPPEIIPTATTSSSLLQQFVVGWNVDVVHGILLVGGILVWSILEGDTIDIVCSTIMLLTSLLSALIVCRWNSVPSYRRPAIRQFLQQMDELSEEQTSTSCWKPQELSGTSLKDIHYVYRRNHNNSAAWTRLPSLVLVPGDWIALQVGDVTPAQVISASNLLLERGVRVTQQQPENLPLGRTTLPPESRHLLTLQHQLKVYRVLQAPIIHLLQEPAVPKQSSQVARQLVAMRITLFIASLVLLTISLVVQWSRPVARQGRYAILPLLAALGACPILSAPLLVSTLHLIGTARILYRVHSQAFRHYSRHTHTLETLGNATVLSLIDDELACEPDAVPQQLLIPSAQGWQLLDLCPDVESDSELDDASLSDEDSDDAPPIHRFSNFRVRRRPASVGSTADSSLDVQFENPNWWQYLPSLKCIGLSCLLVDRDEIPTSTGEPTIDSTDDDSSVDRTHVQAESALIGRVSDKRLDHQLKVLAECIGFSSDPNNFGARGDLTPFTQHIRLHAVSRYALDRRLMEDEHERSSSQSRWWGLIRPESTSVVVQDTRSQAFQMLTVGDPQVIVSLCNEAWQGEISTILPLSGSDRETILETSKDWKLADLDVTAFCYAPVPQTIESRLSGENRIRSQNYLLDNGPEETPLLKDKNVSEEWALIRNQIFLGMLGSLVVPRKEIYKLLRTLNDAGVRFVYFSPRNMRRQKELASQMGIDVAWNCAISLRPLEVGKEDPHRMTSNYADWDVNAKLPHGIEDVRSHLEEVDNVPLLVSLFTDVTKETTRDMIDIFQEYNDSVIAIGLSHLPWNKSIFASAGIAVAIDVLMDEYDDLDSEPKSLASDFILPMEVDFCSAVASHDCAFRFRGASSLARIPKIIEEGRAALEAAKAGALFFVTGSLSFAFYCTFAVFLPSTILPNIPTLGVALFFLFVLPSLSVAMSFTESGEDTMKVVPPKNEQARVYPIRREGTRLYSMIVLKAVFPAICCQLFHLIFFGELLLDIDGEVASTNCSGAARWVELVRCDFLSDYSGAAWSSSGIAVFASFSCSWILGSLTFVRRFDNIHHEPPWRGNPVVPMVLMLALAVVALVAWTTTNSRTARALPAYAYGLVAVVYILSLFCSERCKRFEAYHDRRADKLRRLQFETRLGAWSPR